MAVSVFMAASPFVACRIPQEKMCDATKFALFVACEKCATECATSSFPGNSFPFKAQAFAETSFWFQRPIAGRAMRDGVFLQELHGFRFGQWAVLEYRRKVIFADHFARVLVSGVKSVPV